MQIKTHSQCQNHAKLPPTCVATPPSENFLFHLPPCLTGVTSRKIMSGATLCGCWDRVLTTVFSGTALVQFDNALWGLGCSFFEVLIDDICSLGYSKSASVDNGLYRGYQHIFEAFSSILVGSNIAIPLNKIG